MSNWFVIFLCWLGAIFCIHLTCYEFFFFCNCIRWSLPTRIRSKYCKILWRLVLTLGCSTQGYCTTDYINASFEQSLHVMSHSFKVNMYKRLVGYESKHALLQISEEYDCLKHVGFDNERCGCMLSKVIKLESLHKLVGGQ